jgi:hypothetical protein
MKGKVNVRKVNKSERSILNGQQRVEYGGRMCGEHSSGSS